MQKGADIAADPHCLDLNHSTRAAGGARFAFRSPGSGAILLRVSAPATLVASAACGLPRPLCLGILPAKPLFPVKKMRSSAIPTPVPLLFVASDSPAWTPLEARLRSPTCRRLRDRRPATFFEPPPRSTPGFLAAPWRFSWHKPLMSLQFPASSPLAYSHDAVTLHESHQPQIAGAQLWITWISWTDSGTRFEHRAEPARV